MRKKSMKENAILNALRTLAGIVFPLITYPYISRVLGADNLGKINFANSIVSYFSLLAALGISSYAIREGGAIRDDKNKFKKIFLIRYLQSIWCLQLYRIYYWRYC